MGTFNARPIVLAALLLASFGVSACRRTYVVVPRPTAGYSPMDTLRGRSDGRDVRVTFHFDTTWRVDTVTKLDTLWRGGTRTLVRVDTLRLTDTVVVRTTVRPRLPGTPAGVPSGVDTIRVNTRDTIRVVVRDTIRIVVRDTIRVAGRRTLFVPPGQYPPIGQCRVWIHDRPPGQQARAAPCNALGTIPDGAFILFGGDAWDADYDWVAESRRSSVPTEIVALARRRGGRS
jgi:hypothetical protein